MKIIAKLALISFLVSLDVLRGRAQGVTERQGRLELEERLVPMFFTSYLPGNSRSMFKKNGNSKNPGFYWEA